MCGIIGIIAFQEKAKENFKYLDRSLQKLSKRGPDNQATFISENIALGHARLSIIDTSETANQPFVDETGKFVIVFNGEIFNYKELRKELESTGVVFKTNSDTEVLLKLYIKYKQTCINKLNGFFAFAIYNIEEELVFIARDRYGVKPLIYYKDEDKLIFASEHKAILSFPVKREINEEALFSYFQLNYLPGISILKGFYKLSPGEYIIIKNKEIQHQVYYDIPSKIQEPIPTYKNAQHEIKNILDDAVKLRLVSDVPLGTFLSGGIDSSIITGLASKYVKKLHSFSIGYKDESFFDETKYAQIVAKKFNTEHTVFSLTNNDLLDNLYEVLDYIDEPFADSSALAVYILSKNTRKYLTVSLSGDGADELFSGYNKHMAEYKIRNKGMKEKMAVKLYPLLKSMPQSRNSKFSNIVRQLNKFAEGNEMLNAERYWRWASILSEKQVAKLVEKEVSNDFLAIKNNYLKYINEDDTLNGMLQADLHLVLPNDMLIKVDLMSMANSLEVRTPFLDYRLVNYVATLPASYKIDGKMKKKILQDTFRDFLPVELYNRPKHGFEVPLLKWFRNELKSLIEDLLKDSFIQEQNIFSLSEIKKLKEKLFSANPGDVTATIWALLVFQYWWKKHMLDA